MTKKRGTVTETELAILQSIWDRGNAPVREIVESLYGEHTPALHATVKSLLDRLMAKGLVECDASGFTHLYSAKCSREQYVAEQLEQLAVNHFGGAFTPLLMSLVDRIKLTRKERDAIRKIIDTIPKK